MTLFSVSFASPQGAVTKKHSLPQAYNIYKRLNESSDTVSFGVMPKKTLLPKSFSRCKLPRLHPDDFTEQHLSQRLIRLSLKEAKLDWLTERGRLKLQKLTKAVILWRQANNISLRDGTLNRQIATQFAKKRTQR